MSAVCVDSGGGGCTSRDRNRRRRAGFGRQFRRRFHRANLRRDARRRRLPLCHRRAFRAPRVYHEDDELVARKTVAALAGGLRPIVCVGETLAEREAGVTEEVVGRQLDAVLSLSADDNTDAFADAVHRLRAGLGDRNRRHRDPETSASGARISAQSPRRTRRKLGAMSHQFTAAA